MEGYVPRGRAVLSPPVTRRTQSPRASKCAVASNGTAIATFTALPPETRQQAEAVPGSQLAPIGSDQGNGTGGAIEKVGTDTEGNEKADSSAQSMPHDSAPQQSSPAAERPALLINTAAKFAPDMSEAAEIKAANALHPSESQQAVLVRASHFGHKHAHNATFIA